VTRIRERVPEQGDEQSQGKEELLSLDPLQPREGKEYQPKNLRKKQSLGRRRRRDGRGGGERVRRDRGGWGGEEQEENGWRKICQRQGEGGGRKTERQGKGREERLGGGDERM